MKELCCRRCASGRPGARHAAVLFSPGIAFKLITTVFGTDTGDLVLIQVANRIERLPAPGRSLCRFGGDEVCRTADDMAAAVDAELVRKQIMDGLPPADYRQQSAADFSCEHGVARERPASTARDAIARGDSGT